MKLLCEVRVVNRALPQLAIKSMNKHLKSTLAICQIPKSTKFCIILFSSQNKNGTKYEVNGNIFKVLTKFITEGKATIQFKSPAHDLHIQAGTVLLKSFLHSLRCAIENKHIEKLSFESLGTTPIATKNIPPKKLVIERRSQYPLRGFPSTLEILQINDIERCSFDLGILKLSKLRVLDLSNNCIEYIPSEFSNLPNVTNINLSHNCLGKRGPKDWDWLSGFLTKTLKHLNLSHNNLTFLPTNLIKLYSLVDLNISNNELQFLPSGIGNLQLKSFFASNNKLTSLPGCVKKWRMDTIDLSHNNFHIRRHYVGPLSKASPVYSLRECAAKKVLMLRLNYTPETLVATLIQYLTLAKYCSCGTPCLETYLRGQSTVLLPSIAKNYITSAEENLFIPTDCYYCSLKCSFTRIVVVR